MTTLNKIHWKNVRENLKLPKSDNNEGYIYGFELVQNEEILEVFWYKTKKERNKDFQNELNSNN
jgi:hypothetical protein